MPARMSACLNSSVIGLPVPVTLLPIFFSLGIGAKTIAPHL
jgi:hypothetical protein